MKIRSALFGALALACTYTTKAASNFPLNDTLPPTAASAHADSSKKEVVGVDATFPGGDNKFREYVSTHLNPAVPVEKGAPAGTYQVLIQFIVDKTGKVTEITPLTSYGFGMEEEVMRMLKTCPRWKPAMLLDGTKVNAYRKMPITFVVEEKKRRKLF